TQFVGTPTAVFGGIPATAIFDVLIYEDASGVYPQIAQSMTSTDAVTWTLVLKENVKFSDGTLFDANAVKFNWDRSMNTPGGAAASQLKGVNYSVVDAKTIKLV